MRKSVVLVAMLGALVGCAGGTDSGGSTVTTGGLVVEEQGDRVSGHWTHEGVEIQFYARMLTANILDLEIQLDGMTVTYLADFANATAEFDGYATETGGETQMLDADRDLLAALSRELEELGPDASLPIVKLRDFANVWAEFPSTLDMQGHPPVEPDYHHRSDH